MMSVMRIATFIISVFIVGMVEMMVAGIMNLMSDDLVFQSNNWTTCHTLCINLLRYVDLYLLN